MRRAVTTFLVIAVAIAMSIESAGAASIVVRGDPDDTRFGLDIRKVWSDVSARDVFIQIGTWDRWRNREGTFLVQLDTQGSYAFDLQIEVLPGGPCLVEKLNGQTIGTRDSHRPDRRTIKCRMPTRWFHISKTVGFVVGSDDSSGGSPFDRAPNKPGRFVGL